MVILYKVVTFLGPENHFSSITVKLKCIKQLHRLFRGPNDLFFLSFGTRRGRNKAVL